MALRGALICALVLPMALSMKLSGADAGKPLMSLATYKYDAQEITEMGKVFIRSEEVHQQSMEEIAQSLTTPEAVAALQKNAAINGSSQVQSIMGLLTSNKMLRAGSDANGFGGLDGARRLLNDFIYESSEKYDKEIAKCTDFYSKQCDLMETARGQIATANFVAAKSRALILDADANIKVCERDIPITKKELWVHKRKCASEFRKMNARLKIIMNDIAVMTMILKMSDCDAKFLEMKKLMMLRCEDECGAYATFNHTDLQGEVDKLESPDMKALLSQSFAEMLDDDSDEADEEDGQDAAPKDAKKKDCKVTVYQHGDFKGWNLAIKQGAYTLTKLKKMGFKNDDMSAIKVEGDASCKATVFEHDKYEGKKTVFPVGTYPFKTFTGRGAQNDAISSIMVEKDQPKEKLKLARPPAPFTKVPSNPCTDPYKGAPPPPTKRAGKCTLKKSPRCYKIQGKFLQIQAEIEDARDELMDQIAKQQAGCKETAETLETSIDNDNALLAESQTKLATGTEKEATAGETGRQVAKENKQYNDDLVKQMKICSQNYKDYEMEICALQKIRGDLFKKMKKGHNGFFQDCTLTPWTPEACTKKCAGGEQKIIRSVSKPPGPKTGGGAKCLPLTAKRKCNRQACPINCKLHAWSGWSKCSSKCGGGLAQRVRDVKVAMMHDGTPCAETSESKQCNVEACEKNCVLHPWTKWTRCSKDCDGGTKKKERMIKEPVEGSGTCADKWSTERLKYKACNTKRCKVPDPNAVMECHETLDIILLLDATPKSGKATWAAEVKLANSFVEAFSDAKFAVIHYTGPRTWSGVEKCTGKSKKKIDIPKQCHVKIAQHFERDFEKTQKTINGLKYQPGSKLLSLGLMTAESEFALGRKNARTVVIVFLDGEPLSYRKTRIASKNIRKKARLSFVIIHKFAPLKDIKTWVTRRWQENLVIAKTADEFAKAGTGTHVVANICPAKPPKLKMKNLGRNAIVDNPTK